MNIVTPFKSKIEKYLSEKIVTVEMHNIQIEIWNDCNIQTYEDKMVLRITGRKSLIHVLNFQKYTLKAFASMLT